jgi:hypothetical protein
MCSRHGSRRIELKYLRVVFICFLKALEKRSMWPCKPTHGRTSRNTLKQDLFQRLEGTDVHFRHVSYVGLLQIPKQRSVPTGHLDAVVTYSSSVDCRPYRSSNVRGCLFGGLLLFFIDHGSNMSKSNELFSSAPQ